MLQGKASPLEVVERILAWLDRNNGPAAAATGARAAQAGVPPEGVAWFRAYGEGAAEAARASAARWREGRPLSPLDGVPFAAKDNQDTQGYDTHAGTTFLPQQCALGSYAAL